MDIAHKDLDRMTLQIIKEIAESHFVAVDCEFSGISVRRARNGKPTLQELYEETKEAAEKYQILQVGLTVVSEDIEKGSYVARPYNFHLSPVPALKEEQYTRVWSCTSGCKSSFSKPQLHMKEANDLKLSATSVDTTSISIIRSSMVSSTCLGRKSI